MNKSEKVIQEIQTRLHIGAWQDTASADVMVEYASYGSACNAMVVPHVQQVVAIRKLAEPCMCHQRMHRLPEFGHVRCMVVQSASPKRACTEVVVRVCASIGFALRTAISIIVALHPEHHACIFKIASQEYKHSAPSVAFIDRASQLVEAR